MLDLFALGALNHLLEAAPWARERLRPFAGHRARIVMAPWTLDFRIAADGTLDSLGNAPTEVEITLPQTAPLAALQGREAMIRGALVQGSAAFAEALSFVLRNLDWDAEEDLSRCVGDIAARRLTVAARTLASAARDSARRAAENAAEYLLYEQPRWVARKDGATFAAATAALETATAELERRIAALESGLRPDPDIGDFRSGQPRH